MTRARYEFLGLCTGLLTQPFRLTTDGCQFFCRGAEDVFGGKTDFARFAFSKARLENILSCFETETPNASSLRLLWGVGMTTPSILLQGEFG